MDLHSALKNHAPLIADGATGTQLMKAGLQPGVAPEIWNIERPDAILRHHQTYLDAGSDIVLTNTFGGSSLRLAEKGLDARTEEINLIAAQIARKAAGEDHLVFGDVGPCAAMIEPYGDTNIETVEESFLRQVRGLVDGSVDAILIETQSTIEEAQAAVRAAKKATSLPIIVTFSFDHKGRTMMGVKPSDAALALWPLGLAAIGANCGRTLTETYTAIEAVHAAVPEAVLMAKPNAGLPHFEGSESVYDVTPEIMAEYARKFVDGLGVKIFGGCCGSNPDHIRAIRAELKK
jgi:5-methyltetrahydrofolate--homocysteine methyltransferase